MIRAMMILLLAVGAALEFPVTKVVTRKAALQRVAAGLTVATLSTPTANAYRGVYGMDIISADDAVLDDDAVKSKEVQDAIKAIGDLAKKTTALKTSVDADGQYDVKAALRKDFELTAVRTTFNNLTPAFDKDTQKATDILQRRIIQDIVELDTSANVSAGKQRSEKRIAFLSEKLTKLEQGFGSLDKYVAVVVKGSS